MNSTGPPSKPTAKRLLIAFLKLCISGAALYIVFRNIDTRQVLELYRESDLWLIVLSCLCFIASKAVSAVRLNLFLRVVGLNLPGLDNLKLYLLGMFYNIFLPGGISGDGYKVWLLQKQYRTGTAKLIGAVLVDRVSGVVALYILGVLLVPFMHIRVPYQAWILLSAPLALFALYLFLRLSYRFFLSIFGITSLYAAAVQMMQLISAWLLFKSLGGEGVGVEYMVLFLASSVVAIIPFTIGGAGARELTFLYGATLVGAEMNLAVGISFLFYLITLLVSFTGIYYVIREDRILS
jgi:hypothetical protein